MEKATAGAKANSQVTNKIFLRPIDPSDADVARRCLMDEPVCGYTRWDACETEEEALSLFRNTILRIPWCQAICVEGEGPVGFIFSFIDSCRADMGICIAYEHWGRGIASVAAEMAVQKVLEELPQVMRLEAWIWVGNESSEAVVKKAGFQRDGLLRNYRIKSGRLVDAHLYSRLRPTSKI